MRLDGIQRQLCTSVTTYSICLSRNIISKYYPTGVWHKSSGFTHCFLCHFLSSFHCCRKTKHNNINDIATALTQPVCAHPNDIVWDLWLAFLILDCVTDETDACKYSGYSSSRNMTKLYYLRSSFSGSTILLICDPWVLVRCECGLKITGCGRCYRVNISHQQYKQWTALTDVVVQLLVVVTW